MRVLIIIVRQLVIFSSFFYLLYVTHTEGEIFIKGGTLSKWEGTLVIFTGLLLFGKVIFQDTKELISLLRGIPSEKNDRKFDDMDF